MSKCAWIAGESFFIVSAEREAVASESMFKTQVSVAQVSGILY